MSSFKSLGGYLPLERGQKKSGIHSGAIALNTGRNSLEYVLLSHKIKKLLIPHFYCDVILQPVKKLGIEFEYYKLDDHFVPILARDLNEDESLLFINYFGLFGDLADRLSKRFKNIIIDNSQAFFKVCDPGVTAFNSARKFIGVPDGSYLYTQTKLSTPFEFDLSHDRMEHLTVQIDSGIESGYKAFLRNEEALSNQPIKLMSALTQNLLSTVDYDYIRSSRTKNFDYLQKALGDSSELKFSRSEDDVPLSYPFLPSDPDKMYKELIKNKIFVPRYWPNVLEKCSPSDFEWTLAKLIHLPIDQRYTERQMDELVKMVQKLF